MDPLGSLVEAAARGDAAALRRLLDAVAPAVFRVARSLLGGPGPAAEDAAQESLVGFVAALGRYRGESTVLHYACRIAVHVALNSRRHEAAGRAALQAFENEAVGAASAARASEDELVARRRRELLLSLLDALPEAQAETLALRFVLGCTLREVAEATGAPENTVRSRLRLAKEALQRRLAEEPELAEFLRDTA